MEGIIRNDIFDGNLKKNKQFKNKSENSFNRYSVYFILADFS